MRIVVVGTKAATANVLRRVHDIVVLIVFEVVVVVMKNSKEK